jgi:hypothetical protein
VIQIEFLEWITDDQIPMQFKVLPFVASVSNTQGSGAAAAQLETLINQYSADGWEFVRLESVQTVIAGTSGCFGFGATPAITTVYSMAVFRK